MHVSEFACIEQYIGQYIGCLTNAFSLHARCSACTSAAPDRCNACAVAPCIHSCRSGGIGCMRYHERSQQRNRNAHPPFRVCFASLHALARLTFHVSPSVCSRCIHRSQRLPSFTFHLVTVISSQHPSIFRRVNLHFRASTPYIAIPPSNRSLSRKQIH